MAREKRKNKSKPNEQEISTKIKILAVMAIVFFILGSILVFNSDKLFYLKKYNVPVRFRVSNYSAFNISKNDTSLNFGTVRVNANAERSLDILNTYDFPVKFTYKVTDNLKNLIDYPVASYLRPGERLSVPFKTKIMENTGFGYYTGFIYVTVTKFNGKFRNETKEIIN